MLREDSPVFERFGEIYFSTVYPGVVKGWHVHKRMTLNYAVPVGMIKLVCYDDREDSPDQGRGAGDPRRRAQLRAGHDPALRLERLQGRGHAARRWWPTAPRSRTTPTRSTGSTRSRTTSPTTGRCKHG